MDLEKTLKQYKNGWAIEDLGFINPKYRKLKTSYEIVPDQNLETIYSKEAKEAINNFDEGVTK